MTPDELEQRLPSLPSQDKPRVQKFLANNLRLWTIAVNVAEEKRKSDLRHR